jgi:hypothetical protein
MMVVILARIMSALDISGTAPEGLGTGGKESIMCHELRSNVHKAVEYGD